MDLEDWDENEYDEDYDPEQDEMDEDDDDMQLDAEDMLEQAADEAENEVVISLDELLNNTGDGAGGRRTLAILAALLNQTRRSAAAADDDDSDDGGGWFRRRGVRHHQYSAASEPQPEGVRLQQTGDFGDPAANLTKQPLQSKLRALRRSIVKPERGDLFKDIVPNTIGTVVARYGANVYAGQFSTDSSFYYTCVQDFRLHIYDTKAPMLQQAHSDQDHVSTMKHIKSVHAVPGGWTITDSHLSPDNRLLAYAIMSPKVFLASTTPDGDAEQRSINFGQSRSDYDWHDRYGIWSCRFSADGNEIVAGGSGKLMVYDLAADRRSVKIEAHRADVNSCCWADSGGNVLISASDDSFVKVWDRRSLGMTHKPAGVLIGHTEGITYVAPKGDGRYVISNGKDQTLKLWDLRKMSSFTSFLEVRKQDYGIPDFDYRAQAYPKPKYDHHPQDCSVMSYRGHSVLRTLIRCNFSPAETTGSRYILSGSADGMVHIWSLDGTLVQRMDRSDVNEMGYDPSGTEYSPSNMVKQRGEYRATQLVVRDVAWHSQEPVVMSCSWATQERPYSEVAKHEWKGLNKLGGRLEDFIERERQEARERPIPAPPRGGSRWY
ncbi:LEC14B protein [Serendipita indica DSM 11827]|nr:LEC14B protein [Serendipita indica DSM 11827]